MMMDLKLELKMMIDEAWEFEDSEETKMDIIIRWFSGLAAVRQEERGNV